MRSLQIMSRRRSAEFEGVWDSNVAPLQLGTLERVSWTVLSAAFGRKEVCTSEPAGPVRAFSLATGGERWRYKPRGLTLLRSRRTRLDRLSFESSVRSRAARRPTVSCDLIPVRGSGKSSRNSRGPMQWHSATERGTWPLVTGMGSTQQMVATFAHSLSLISRGGCLTNAEADERFSELRAASPRALSWLACS